MVVRLGGFPGLLPRSAWLCPVQVPRVFSLCLRDDVCVARSLLLWLLEGKEHFSPLRSPLQSTLPQPMQGSCWEFSRCCSSSGTTAKAQGSSGASLFTWLLNRTHFTGGSSSLCEITGCRQCGNTSPGQGHLQVSDAAPPQPSALAALAAVWLLGWS